MIGGDGLSLSIAAASVIAKVTRDRLMRRLALRYAGYGWDHNVGYATAEHRAAIRRLGATPHHRRSFAPVQPGDCRPRPTSSHSLNRRRSRAVAD